VRLAGAFAGRALPSPVGRALLLLTLAGLAIGGCYDPSFRNCTVACAQASDCSPDQICGGDGWCAEPDVAGRCDGIRDAEPDAPTPDADVPDPSPDAATGCKDVCAAGTCVDGVCTIDCSAEDTCANDVICPTGVPCRVICGDSSCDKHVDCTRSTSCTVECEGNLSCQDEIRCGNGPCDVSCNGYRSCAHRVKCAESCRCDVDCLGIEACHDPAECPADACDFGFGCTTETPGCDQCGG
jgi:hypothetical protein